MLYQVSMEIPGPPVFLFLFLSLALRLVTNQKKCKNNYLDYMRPKNGQIFGRAGKEEVVERVQGIEELGEKCGS